MSASIKSFLVMLCILPLILFISTQVSDEDYAIPIVFVVLVLGFAFKQLVASQVRFDAFMLGTVALGYIVGNRGFAAIGPSASVPLFVGELTMVLCLLYMVAQQIIHHHKFIPPYTLAKVLIVYLAYGGIRLFFDVRTYGVLAIRDSAMVYYSLFFFIAYQAGQDEKSRRFFEKALVRALIILIPTGLLTRFAPSLYEFVTLRGVPIIYQKGDIAAIFCATGAVVLYCYSFHSRWPRFLGVCTFLVVGLLGVLGARSGLLSLLVPIGFLAIARMNRLVIYLGTLLLATVVATLIYVQVTKTEAVSLEVYSLYSKYLAILDPNGEFDYDSSAGVSSAANNQFRLVWWQTVIDDTVEKSPLVGLGFGYDLTEHFMQVYYGATAVDAADVRSPHSYYVSAFGRMGLVGLIFVFTITYHLVRGCLRAALAVRHGHGDRRRLAMWLGAMSIFVGALFGVVLEGPMGGILFWSLLGMAYVYDREAALQDTEVPVTHLESSPAALPLPGRPVPAGFHRT